MKKIAQTMLALAVLISSLATQAITAKNHLLIIQHEPNKTVSVTGLPNNVHWTTKETSYAYGDIIEEVEQWRDQIKPASFTQIIQKPTYTVYSFKTNFTHPAYPIISLKLTSNGKTKKRY